MPDGLCIMIGEQHVSAQFDWPTGEVYFADDIGICFTTHIHSGEILDARVDWKGENAASASAVTELPGGAGLLFGSLHGNGVAMVCFDEEHCFE